MADPNVRFIRVRGRVVPVTVRDRVRDAGKELRAGVGLGVTFGAIKSAPKLFHDRETSRMWIAAKKLRGAAAISVMSKTNRTGAKLLAQNIRKWGGLGITAGVLGGAIHILAGPRSKIVMDKPKKK
jgi:hypothetical protein